MICRAGVSLIQPLDFQPVSGGPVIFLAGPIAFASPWQEKTFDIIGELAPDIVVASPRRIGPEGRYGRIRLRA